MGCTYALGITGLLVGIIFFSSPLIGFLIPIAEILIGVYSLENEDNRKTGITSIIFGLATITVTILLIWGLKELA